MVCRPFITSDDPRNYSPQGRSCHPNENYQIDASLENFSNEDTHLDSKYEEDTKNEDCFSFKNKQAAVISLSRSRTKYQCLASLTEEPSLNQNGCSITGKRVMWPSYVKTDASYSLPGNAMFASSKKQRNKENYQNKANKHSGGNSILLDKTENDCDWGQFTFHEMNNPVSNKNQDLFLLRCPKPNPLTRERQRLRFKEAKKKVQPNSYATSDFVSKIDRNESIHSCEIASTSSVSARQQPYGANSPRTVSVSPPLIGTRSDVKAFSLSSAGSIEKELSELRF
mmetsp:Transcript_25148/g.36979  ORF Transcript_25148/g.36979 Transcript_25148/m.36979 type:complete len:283 (-) Transcript_25148:97-945(-)